MLQNDDEGRAGPRGSRANPGSDIEDLVRKVKDKFTRVTPDRGPRRFIVYAVLALVVLAGCVTVNNRDAVDPPAQIALYQPAHQPAHQPAQAPDAAGGVLQRFAQDFLASAAVG